MKKLAVILCIILTACSVQLIRPLQLDIDRVKDKYPGYTLQELNEGQALYIANCQSCHRLKRPESFTEQRWTEIVPKMVARVNKKAGTTVIDKNYQGVLLRYLVTMGTAPRAK